MSFCFYCHLSDYDKKRTDYDNDEFLSCNCDIVTFDIIRRVTLENYFSNQNIQCFSIRKYSFDVSSVLLGTQFMTQEIPLTMINSFCLTDIIGLAI